MPNSSTDITFEQLAELREKTEAVSGFLSKRLRQHLATLNPILAPKRIFGKYVGSKDSAPRADEAYAQLMEKYKEASGSPFGLRSDLDDAALSEMEGGIEFYPWEYTYNADGKAILMTHPFRWAVTYKSAYSLAHIRSLYTQSQSDKRPNDVRYFVVNALALQIAVARIPGATQLFEDLRYEVKPEAPPGLGRLTMLTIGGLLGSFRPPDELILMATRFSGIPAFIELIDQDALANLPDPFRARIESLLI
jgi:hypothetical protein